jgi:hypothetical protein
MNLLYFWRGDNYRRDLDFGAGYHLNQNNPLLHSIDIGESLWAFTRKNDDQYALAAHLIIAAKTINKAGFRYGRYRVWGNLCKSRYFQVDLQPDISMLVRNLGVSARGDVLGRAFQGNAAVRAIDEQAQAKLLKYAEVLPIEHRATLLPEERLETLILTGDGASVERLLKQKPVGLAEERRRYLMTTAIQRDRELTERLRDLYDGQCQVCGWAPRRRYRQELCEAHHVRWLSRGGQDDFGNLTLLCPNHHRAVHRCDAPFDFELMAFVFSNFNERLSLQRHDLETS